MQYHALSIARHGGDVDIIGYHGDLLHSISLLLYADGYTKNDGNGIESEPHPEIMSNPRISIVPLPSHPAFLQTSNKLLFLFYAPLKILLQVVYLWNILAYRTKPARWLLVQVSYHAPHLLNPCGMNEIETSITHSISPYERMGSEMPFIPAIH
jgi:beta-1,4-mannosyltransferase